MCVQESYAMRYVYLFSKLTKLRYPFSSHIPSAPISLQLPNLLSLLKYTKWQFSFLNDIRIFVAQGSFVIFVKCKSILEWFKGTVYLISRGLPFKARFPCLIKNGTLSPQNGLTKRKILSFLFLNRYKFSKLPLSLLLHKFDSYYY